MQKSKTMVKKNSLGISTYMTYSSTIHSLYLTGIILFYWALLFKSHVREYHPAVLVVGSKQISLTCVKHMGVAPRPNILKVLFCNFNCKSSLMETKKSTQLT